MPGSLMIGPLDEQAADRFLDLLDLNDLHFSLEDAPVVITKIMHGNWMATAEGLDVRGYLQARDGCEAPSHDIERLARAVLPEGGKLTIQGYHRLQDDHFVVCKMVLVKKDGRIISEREHIANKIGQGTRVLIQERQQACLMAV